MIQKEYDFSPFSDIVVHAFYYNEAKPSKTIKQTYHGDRYTLIIPDGGGYEGEITDGEKRFVVPSGCAALIAPFAIWEERSVAAYYAVMFDCMIADNISMDNGVAVFPIGETVLFAARSLANGDPTDDFSLSLKVTALMLDALSSAENESGERRSLTGNKITDGFISLVEEKYAEEIKLDDVCKEFNVTLSAFNHTVKRTLGVSPHRYVISVRIRKAKELLRNTDMSVETISALTGYEYCGHFCNEFRKNVGITPAEYRKKIYI